MQRYSYSNMSDMMEPDDRGRYYRDTDVEAALAEKDRELATQQYRDLQLLGERDEKIRHLENDVVETSAIYEAISDILRDGKTSDFMMSFSIVSKIADLRDRVCCLPDNEWGHTDLCPRKELAEAKAEIERHRNNIDTTEAAIGMSGIYAKQEQEIAALREKLGETEEVIRQWEQYDPNIAESSRLYHEALKEAK